MTDNLGTDGYPEDWTERPHWVVIEVESPGEEACIGHWPTKALAREQASKVNAQGRRAYVGETT